MKLLPHGGIHSYYNFFLFFLNFIIAKPKEENNRLSNNKDKFQSRERMVCGESEGRSKALGVGG